jgi:conjugative relaxase-like TrwC/TraI family protein
MIAFSKINDVTYHIRETYGQYHLKNGENIGIYSGLGSAMLGLFGEIEEEPYLKLMEGLHPFTGRPLYQNNGKKHRPGFDLVFNAPKSVSVVWARAPKELRLAIEKAQHNAVQKALKFIEKHAAYTRRGKDGKTHEKVMGLVAALFQHSTSRLEDPHLHTHCVLMNIAPRLDQTYGSLESIYILKFQKAASLLYKSTLAEQLRELGFDTSIEGYSFSLNGVSKEICNHYSKRRMQILGALEAKGINSYRASNLAARMTRQKKKAINKEGLLATWKVEMNELGFTQEKLNLMLSGIHIHDELDFTHFALSQQFLSNFLTESVSIFSEVDVYNAAIYTSMRLALPAQSALKIAERFLSSSYVLELDTYSKSERKFTTHEMRNLELQLIKNAQELKNRTFISGLSINNIIKAQTHIGLELSEEQQEAILGVLGNSSFEILSGSAGSGKSTSMAILSSVYRSSNVNVWGATIAKSAAKNLEQETNVKSFTIAKLLLDLDNAWSKIRANDVVIIDESGQVGVRQMLKLQEHAIEKGFKLVLTGEDKQLDAIQHGGVLRYLSRPEVIGTTRIETIRRQNQEWDRTAVANFRDGKASESLKKYHHHNRLHFNKDIDSTYSALVADWNKYRQENPNKKSMVLARTWNDVLELNSLMRSQLQSSGEVEKQDLEIKGLVGSREINFLLSVNDRVRFTRNDSNLGYTNGDIGTVIKVIKDSNDSVNIAIKRDDGKLVTVTQSNYSNDKGQIYLAPAYAQTIYSSQGQTVDCAFVLHDQMINRANAYVALSRHKDDCHLYASLDVFFEDGEAPTGIQVTNKKVIEKIAAQYASEKRATLSIEYEPIAQELSKNEVEKADIEYELDLV